MKEEIFEKSIRNFVLERFPLARQRSVSNQESLLENGILDSLGILEVVTFLEGEFLITVDDDELQPENFASIASMSAYVGHKRTAGSVNKQG
ncbi:MAG: acyl carrier protein [Nitrospira sp.]